jgi:RNA polymerase sigma-70 factor (ECF subfamily)
MSQIGSIARPASTFESLLPPLLDAAHRMAMRLTRHRPDAEDLVQDAALNACRGFASFEPGSNFKAWFFRILYNCFLSRQGGRRVERSMVDLDDASELELVQRSADAGRGSSDGDPAALARMQSAEVVAALQSLPEEYRTVATMCFIQEFTYQEVARLLAIPVGTVRSRLHRGRRILQARLKALAEDHGIVLATAVHSGG